MEQDLRRRFQVGDRVVYRPNFLCAPRGRIIEIGEMIWVEYYWGKKYAYRPEELEICFTD